MKHIKRIKEMADDGHIESMYMLANHYESHGNSQKAEEYYHKAAEEGYIPAMYALFLLYQHLGRKTEAAIYFHKAAEEGYIPEFCQ